MDTNSRQNPYLVIVGCQRSGTTLLQRMLDRHPQLAVVNEARFIPVAIEERAVPGINPSLSAEVVDRVRRHPNFTRLDISEAAVHAAAAGAHTYAQFVSALFSQYAQQHAKPLAGEKDPYCTQYLPLLKNLFPWVKIIHIIRDGRDVALSTLEWAREGKGPGKLDLWREQPLAACALWWQWQVGAGMRDGAALAPVQYLEVAYENLVVTPEETLRRIASFLELPFSPKMLTYHVGKTRHRPSFSTKKAWLPPTAGLRDWQAQMAPYEIELFEAIAGDLLSSLGYKRACDRVSSQIAALAQRCRQRWEAEMVTRQGRIGACSGTRFPAAQAKGNRVRLAENK